MAIVKCKKLPWSSCVVKVVNADLHKGKPYAPLLRKTLRMVVVTTTVVLQYVTSAVVTSTITN